MKRTVRKKKFYSHGVYIPVGRGKQLVNKQIHTTICSAAAASISRAPEIGTK